MKSAPQKLNFLMEKSIQKFYTLNWSRKYPCTFPYSYALLRHLFFKKNHFMWNKHYFLQPREPKMRQNQQLILKLHWKWIRGHVEHFCKFCLCQQLFAFKLFCMETRLSNIFKTTNATKFIKTILERTYKVVLGKYNLAAPTRPVFLLRAVDI